MDNNLSNYEIMKKHLTMKLVPVEKIKRQDNMLYPIRPWFDLRMMPSVVWGSAASMDVSFEIAESWGVDITEVFRDAMENMENQTEYQPLSDAIEELINKNKENQTEYQPLSDAIEELINKNKETDDPELREMLDNYDSSPNNVPIYLLSNKARFFGAGSLLNVDAMTDIAKYFKSDILIIPSSIHEVLLMPRNVYGDQSLEDIETKLTGIIRAVNDRVVHPADQLSDHPYMFGRDDYGQWSYMSLEFGALEV